MFDNLNEIIITKICLATFVAPNTGHLIHNNRSFHGLVLNGKDKQADFVFSDGFVLKTYENSLLYLPKGSNYKVIPYYEGEGCWAINFDLLNSIDTKPFSVKLQNPEYVLTDFKKSVNSFRYNEEHCNLIIMKHLYNILIQLIKEYEKKYTPNKKLLLIKPALDLINNNFCDNDISVKELSNLCGISEAYFRRIFTDKFGISPKEYIINNRIEYAKKLLLSDQFSVSEVAQMCGYFEPCHFSREFSKRTGVSPNKYNSFVLI